MLSFVQRLLELSMRLDNSKYAMGRFWGWILGIFPVWYSERLEKKLFREDCRLAEKLYKRYSGRKHPRSRKKR